MVKQERTLKIYVKGELVFQYGWFPEDFNPEDIGFTIVDSIIPLARNDKENVVKSFNMG